MYMFIDLLALLIMLLTSATDYFDNKTSDLVIDETVDEFSSESTDEFSDETDEFREEDTAFVHGTADTPEGTTVVVTILADEEKYKWDMESAVDKASVSDINGYLKVAGRFLEQVVSDYGKNATFITDFESNPDLMYRASFDMDMTDTDYVDEPSWLYIDENIDTEAIIEKYNAQNVIFLEVFNSDEYSNAVTCTRNWYEGMEYPYEVIYLYNYDYGQINGPAVYAHEMLHAFGAPDLYTEDEFFNIDGDVISYVENNLQNEIMYTCTDLETYEYTYDRITNEVTDLTAYYVGLTEYSEVAEKLGLTGNEHY